LENVGICYDIGHDDGTETPESFERVAAIHLNDNDGNTDDHAVPFEGIVRWPAFVDRLVSEGFSGPMVMEVATTDARAIRNAIDRLEKLTESARNSIEEFRLEHGIRSVNDNDLH
jgi:sugar phosphate isomerase/epimerase